MKECDARTEKHMELLDKYGDSPEAEAKISREMGWERELTEEEAEEERRRIAEINAACEAALNEPEPDPDPHREGIDWVRTADGDLRHPLQHRCFESAMKFWHEADELGLDETADKDLDQFIFEFQTTGVKLAGALNSMARGADFTDAAFTVARLKRALGTPRWNPEFSLFWRRRCKSPVPPRPYTSKAGRNRGLTRPRPALKKVVPSSRLRQNRIHALPSSR